MGLSRGRSLAVGFAKQPGVELKYVCDVDSQRAEAGARSVAEASGQTPQPIGDFRKILDDPEVDVLVCAAPNHWHAPATILGCQAGKHVYVEKPCSHNPAEGEMMLQAARKHNRCVQMGSQRRSSPTMMQAIELLREGVIGRVYQSRSWYNSARGPLGIGKPAEVPANIDYELWQGPAPRTPYLDNRLHYNWHWFWHWGNGELGNNGVHALDLCRWGLEADFPVRVTSSGGRYRFEDDQQTPDTHTVCFEFPDGKMATWSGLSCNRHKHGFVAYYGENGTMAVDARCGFVIYDDKDKEVRTEKGVMDDADHFKNFLEAIRSDKPESLNAEIEIGYRSTLLCHLGNIAQRTGRTLTCSADNGHIIGDEKAMGYWKREYAPGWEPHV